MARAELLEQDGDVVWATVVQPRKTMPDVPLSRFGTAAELEEMHDVLGSLTAEHRRLALQLLRSGLGKWKQWAPMLRRAPAWLDIATAEREVMPLLLRTGLVSVKEKPVRAGSWALEAFTTRVAPEVLGVFDGDAERHRLRTELRDPALAARIDDDPPRGMDMRTYAFCLRAANTWLDAAARGSQFPERELAAIHWHSKAFTDARRRLLGDLVGRPVEELFARRPRQIRIRGPLINPEASIWADTARTVELEPRSELLGIVCVENLTTFEALLEFSDRWVVLYTQGEAPHAEVHCLARAHALVPSAPVLAAMDPDPAGVAIALSLARRSGVRLDPVLMSAAAFAQARRLPLVEWDRERLGQLAKGAGPHADLVAAMQAADAKGEQESLHPWLRDEMSERTRRLMTRA